MKNCPNCGEPIFDFMGWGGKKIAFKNIICPQCNRTLKFNPSFKTNFFLSMIVMWIMAGLITWILALISDVFASNVTVIVIMIFVYIVIMLTCMKYLVWDKAELLEQTIDKT